MYIRYERMLKLLYTYHFWGFMINLREKLGNSPHLNQLEILIKVALLDPSESFRQNALNRIADDYPGIRRGFVGDNQIMLELNGGYGESKLLYLCDLPKEYQKGIPAVPIPFTLE